MNFDLRGIEPFNYIIIILFSFLLVYLAIPSIIHVATKHQLFDNNIVERKNQRFGISRLGGIAIFCSLILTTLLFADFLNSSVSNYLITAFILVFSVGLKDDLWGVNASTKFFVQLLAALTIVVLADIRITSMHGIFDIYLLPYWASVVFSALLIIFITNSFNLIDGIDGLVGLTSMAISLIFGLFFANMDQYSYACISFTVAGASLGFLRFNMWPARIFMGDAGSMLIGLVVSVLAIKFIEFNTVASHSQVFYQSAPAICMAVLIGPIFDLMRVFLLRLWKKSSPFVADNNHIHHRLLRAGFTHLQSAVILVSFNNFMVVFVVGFRGVENTLLIGAMFICCIVFNIVLSLVLRYKEREVFQSSGVASRFAKSSA